MDAKTRTTQSPEPGEGGSRLGIPRSRMDGAMVVDKTMGAKTTTRRSPEPRDGSSGLGTPVSSMDGARVLDDQESDETRRQADEELRRQLEEFQRQSEKELQQPENFMLPPGIRRALTWGGCALAAVLGLFLVSQGVTTGAAILALPAPFNWIVGAVALLFAGTLFWLTVQLVWMLVRLRRNPSVNLHAIQALQERRHMQALATEHAEQAVRELRIYLENYQLNDDARRRLLVLGLTDRELDDLAQARRTLLANNEPMPPVTWLSEFRGQFQSILDRVANARVKQYVWQVGLGTGVSRIAVIDSAVVLYACLALIKDLTVLYGLRPALGTTATILIRSIVQTYLAGLLQEATDSAADTLKSELTEYLEVAAAGAATIAGAATAGLGRMAEGAVNGVFVWRLGKQAISFLQPAQPTD